MNSNIGDKINTLFELREEKRRLEAEIRTLEQQMDPYSLEILQYLNEQKMKNMATTRATAIVSISEVPTVEDWDAFHNYLLDTRQPYLLERRVSVAGFRDLWQAGEQAPGVNRMTKSTLLLRKSR